jgi:hypothetical protein
MLRDGSNYGNVFLNCDFEAGTNAVFINNAASVNNTWIGGTISLATNGINAIAGSGNMFLNGYINTPSLTNVAPNRVGVNIKSSSYATPTVPSVPASSVAATNNSGFTVLVCINGGTISLVSRNGTGVYSVNASVAIVLNPGDTIAITYSSVPSWTWVPIQ